MSKTCQQEKNKIEARPKRDAKGRLLPGNSANLAGKNGFTAIRQLLDALHKRGKDQKQDFWDMVAKRVWSNDQVLIAILKKLIPDRQSLEHELPEHLLDKLKEMSNEDLRKRAQELALGIVGSAGRNRLPQEN